MNNKKVPKKGAEDKDPSKTKTVKKRVQPVDYKPKDEGIQIISTHAHKGWITKIKYYPDLNYIMSSSLDGFIHYH